MKIVDLFENKDQEILDWFKEHTLDAKGNLRVENGLLMYDGKRLIINDDVSEIKYPIGKLSKDTIFDIGRDGDRGQLISVKNFPQYCLDVYAPGQRIKKIDHPIIAEDTINLCRNQIESLKNIHKYVQCKELRIFNNPVKDSILGLLKIQGLTRLIVPGPGAVDDSNPVNLQFHKALKIVVRYLGRGNAGLIKAQRELIDNDLEDYAEF